MSGKSVCTVDPRTRDSGEVVASRRGSGILGFCETNQGVVVAAIRITGGAKLLTGQLT